MYRIAASLVVLLCFTGFVAAADATIPTKPVSKVIPGKVIVPTDAMRRIWGELVSLDLKTRTGTFRKDGTDEILSFTVLPYAELLHHATFGDLQDFRIGERAIFRLHENDKGEWTWLTYIQDQMNMMNGHKEYFYVDAIDAAKGEFNCTQANFDKSFIREKGIVISTDSETRYWKEGAPAKFTDIKVGDKIRTKTHGVGKGKTQMCWEVFLDDASLLKFQNEQKALEARRLAEEGAPGYVDSLTGSTLDVTLFQEASDISRSLKPGQPVRCAPAGVDRKPTTAPVPGSVSTTKMAGNLGKVTITLSGTDTAFPVGAVLRVWTK